VEPVLNGGGAGNSLSDGAVDVLDPVGDVVGLLVLVLVLLLVDVGLFEELLLDDMSGILLDSNCEPDVGRR
jgi:hypothetical protein